MKSELWIRLKATPPKGDALTARIAFPEVSSRLLAGIDAEGYRHFLVQLSTDEAELNDTQSRGITVTCKDLQVRGQAREIQQAKYMDIVCQESGGYDAFDIIGKEIANSLALGGNTTSEVVKGILARWRRFWVQPPKNLLSREEVIGLFAELWFLHHWLLPNMDQNAAVSRWRGPYSSRHDFEWVGNSIEVKATTSTRGRIHRIHGIEQLSPPQEGKLSLFSLRLREEGGATNTLPSIITSCRSVLGNNPDALTSFENSLALTGYSPLHDDEYAKICFRVVDEALYAVKSPFPSITPDKFRGGVPLGVEKVDYEINLDGYGSLIIARTPIQITIL